jgi:uncharacterized repeat protein (TIGR03803 family)
LYSFGSVQDTNGVPLDGAYPAAGLVQGSDGNFYGTTSDWNPTIGGYCGCGTVFKISTNGALTTLHSLDWWDCPPKAGLVLGTDGYFYGTTEGMNGPPPTTSSFTAQYSKSAPMGR